MKTTDDEDYMVDLLCIPDEFRIIDDLRRMVVFLSRYGGF